MSMRTDRAARRRLSCFAGASLLGLTLVPSVAAVARQTFPPIELRGAKQYPGCPGGGGTAHHARAIDISAPADAILLAKARDSGIDTIIRYYDWPEIEGRLHPRQCVLGGRTRFNRQFDLRWRAGPTFAGKTITRDEIRRMHAMGFRIGIVFQHCNQNFTTFVDTKRAAFDADRSLELAATLGQPRGTTIFFGADFDAAQSHIERIRRYFRTAGAIVKPRGYRIGAYGNGYVCSELKADGLVSSCWLSQSTGFLGSHAFQAAEAWDMQQCATRAPFKGSRVHFDPDVLNPNRDAIGWWLPTGR